MSIVSCFLTHGVEFVSTYNFQLPTYVPKSTPFPGYFISTRFISTRYTVLLVHGSSAHTSVPPKWHLDRFIRF